MTDADDSILELLADSGLALNKKTIHVNFDIEGISTSYSTVKRRLAKLEQADLIELVREKGRYYRISKLGEAYLNGDHQPTNLDH